VREGEEEEEAPESERGAATGEWEIMDVEEVKSEEEAKVPRPLLKGWRGKGASLRRRGLLLEMGEWG
jgi:hypothetical protein